MFQWTIDIPSSVSLLLPLSTFEFCASKSKQTSFQSASSSSQILHHFSSTRSCPFILNLSPILSIDPPCLIREDGKLCSLLPILVLFFLLHSSSPNPTKTPKWHLHHHLKLAHSTCEGTLYPELCVSTLSTFPDIATKTIPQVISATVNHTVAEVYTSASNCSSIRKHLSKLNQKRALDDCLELLEETIVELTTAVSDLSKKTPMSKHYHDLETLLSAAMTNQYTCLDGLSYSNGIVKKSFKESLHKITHLVSNSLAMLKKLKLPKGSKEEFSGYGEMIDGFPSWVSRKDRRLLQSSMNATKFDLVVAKDGSGNFTTIGDAVAAAPNSTTERFVIYVKAGAYFENVEVERKKTMLMFVGDGIGKTVVKASRNVFEGWTTFRSATVAVVGNGFIARDMTFENSAGPSKHQAVALRSGSDLSAFYRCSFVGYQDTLYVHSLRQFYRECDIYGTVDFIFGNAAVVFQNCNLYARRPNDNQKNVFTAQGKEDPNQNTGISIINSKVAAAADLISVKSSFKSYLGRPWKEYSTTVFIGCNMEDLIDPAGWVEWSGDFALSTLYYGEYMNTGVGANTTSRVKWPGYRVINSSTEASRFSVANFIQGNDWLSSSEIPYDLYLS